MTYAYQPTKKIHPAFWIIAVAGMLGISYLRYQDMVQPIPEFASLREVPSSGMKCSIGEAGMGGHVSFEFTDSAGLRYQATALSTGQAELIKEAMEQGPVTLFVGKWKSPLPSDSIFTVYHMTAGDETLLDYRAMAAGKQREKSGAFPVMVLSALLVAGAIYMGLRLRPRWVQESDRAPNTSGGHPSGQSGFNDP